MDDQASATATRVSLDGKDTNAHIHETMGLQSPKSAGAGTKEVRATSNALDHTVEIIVDNLSTFQVRNGGRYDIRVE